MKRHEIDIESLKEKHRLDMEAKEKEHQLRIEEIKVKNEQEILKKEKELLNSATYSMMGDATKGLFSGMLNSPEVKKALFDDKTSEIDQQNRVFYRYKDPFALTKTLLKRINGAPD